MSSWYELSEDVLIFQMKAKADLARMIKIKVPEVIDAVATEVELAIQHISKDVDALVGQIIPLLDQQIVEDIPQEFVVPVCYDLGIDWEEVQKQTGLVRSEIEQLHQSVYYEVSYGFTPGFLYLAGLPDNLHCSRKAVPRTQVPKGAVGIGGEKTGIYSLPTPGGWQIIGQTPMTLFDPDAQIPTPIPDGSKLKFKAISKKEFEEYGGA